MHTATQSAQLARASAGDDPAGALDRLVGCLADVRPGEGAKAALLFLNVALVLAACYLVKPVRDALLAASGAGLQLKAQATAAQAVVFVALVPLYMALARRVARRRLSAYVNLTFATGLALFWFALDLAPASRLAVAFYVWTGAFGAVVVSQFWSFAADVCREDGGRRLFPFIAIGASVGAMAASGITERLASAESWTAASSQMAAAILLAVSAMVTHTTQGWSSSATLERADRAMKARASFSAAAILSRRYLLLMLVFAMVLNWVTTNGEHLLFGRVQELISAELQTRAVTEGAELRQLVVDRTTAFYGGLFFWMNLLTLVLQLVIASRARRTPGCALGLMFLPAIAFASYALMALLPALGMIQALKATERATAHSLQNTAVQLLWLPVPDEMKYEGKLWVDTLGVRLGDALASMTIIVGMSWLQLPLAALLLVNLALIAVWFGLSKLVAVEHARLAG